jgi:hypothetical protein
VKGNGRIQQTQVHQQARFVNERIVAEAFGRSVKTLRNDRVQRRGLPYYRLRGQILYDLAECEALIRAGRLHGGTNQQ